MKTKNKILRLMKEEYRSHLLGVLKEVSLFNSKGELVISPDLKVIHEPSGYEYTVDSVNGKDGSAEITLRMPDVPRPTAKNPEVPDSSKGEEADSVEDPGSEEIPEDFPKIEIEEDDTDDKDSKVDVGVKAYPDDVEAPEEDEEAEGDTFVIDQKEFEKNYKEA